MSTTTDAERSYYALVHNAFEKLAPVYDLIALPVARLRHQAVEFAAAPPGSNVLDVATGTGSQAIAFAQRGHPVAAIDLSEAMLRVARRKTGAELVAFEAGDATHLRFAADTFDVVTTSFALHTMPPAVRERSLGEMVRVARPGATILIVDYALPPNPIGRAMAYNLIQLFMGPHYAAFARMDLRAALEAQGATMIAERPVLLGAARIWKGRKNP